MQPSDADLLKATPSDPQQFGRFYQRHEDAVLAFMLRRVREPEVAADLAAETFATALLHVRRYKPERGEARAWLFGIARNTLNRSLEKRRVEDRARRRLGIARLDLAPDVAAAVEALASEAQALRVLSELPDDEAVAVRGRVINGASYADLAVELHVPEPTVRKRVSRGLARLRTRKDLT